MCSCNGHSTICVFDSDVYSQSGETSGGVCINCQDNTAGRQCDQCATSHYQIPGLDISDVNACQREFFLHPEFETFIIENHYATLVYNYHQLLLLCLKIIIIYVCRFALISKQ